MVSKATKRFKHMKTDNIQPLNQVEMDDSVKRMFEESRGCYNKKYYKRRVSKNTGLQDWQDWGQIFGGLGYCKACAQDGSIIYI